MSLFRTLKLFVLSLLLTFCLPLTAVQAQEGALSVGLPAPTAASLGKFGDVPVSLYTGTPCVQAVRE